MREMDLERLHLEKTKKVIADNIADYENAITEGGELVKELFVQVHEGDRELYGQATDNQGIQEHFKLQLKRNLLALEIPYFGRIDVKEQKDGSIEKAYYIGKRGVADKNKDVVVVDWRAPIASVYYDNEKGLCQYFVDEETRKDIELLLKRSLVIEKGELKGFFDSDAVVNDELLIKYLSQNAKAVLGDIISTIQEEQNAIIRATPFRNMMVQGVAGSGKTSVIVHRIAYILYNFSHRFRPNEFCIVGGSDRLVDYIASGLPELDVFNVHSMRMDELFAYFLGDKWKKKYKRCQLAPLMEYKTQCFFVKRLEEFLQEYRNEKLSLKLLRDKQLGILLKRSSMLALMEQFPEKSLNQFFELFDDRVKEKITSVCGGAVEIRNRKIKEYRNYYQRMAYKGNLIEIYLQFLAWFGGKEQIDIQSHVEAIQKGCFDLYDMAALVLIFYRIARTEDMEDFEQLFIDEAQDYGIAIYYVLKKCLPKTYFNIVGDVSQNINYHGLNDWDELKQIILQDESEEPFYLSKSYRNTIEISNFAGKILEEVGSGAYKITPVIRHGHEVENIDVISNQEGIAVIEQKLEEFKTQGYGSIAVICFDPETTAYIEKKLCKRASHLSEEERISVLSVEDAKGLEFDAVLVWRPEWKRIAEDAVYAKKVYVAATRALHELCIVE